LIASGAERTSSDVWEAGRGWIGVDFTHLVFISYIIAHTSLKNTSQQNIFFLPPLQEIESLPSHFILSYILLLGFIVFKAF
jgi:hypothetical protein